MTNPITPPPELVQQWRGKAVSNPKDTFSQSLATRAAQWGSDQELEACCELLVKQGFDFVDALRAARRPKPPSLKEQALEAMHRNWNPHNNDDFATIARALEALDD